jgi:putative ABC transport system permease protein
MKNFWQDLRFGLRGLRRTPVVTAIAIAALALGIGANSAIFSVVNTVLLRPLPYPQPEQLIWFWESQPDLEQAPFSAADFLDFQSQNQTFAQMAALRQLSFTLTGRGQAERVPGIVSSPTALAVLGIRPILGRDFLPSEGTMGARRVAILTYGFWQSHFGGDPSVVNQNITLDGQPVEIVGVLPAAFRYGNHIELWVNPVNIAPEVFSPTPDWERKISTNRETHYLSVIGRLKPGVTREQAQADINRIVAHFHEQFVVTTGHNALLIPLSELSTGPIRQTLLILLAVVGLVLLIACANVANLLLARAVARRREIAVRTALGAGRWRLVRQLLTESMLLSFSGGVIGVFLAASLIRLLSAAKIEDLPRVSEMGVDFRVLAFTFCVCVLTGLLFGLAPALAATRQTLSGVLKEGERGATGLAHNRMRSLLVIGEVGLSLVLLVGAGLLTRSFIRLFQINPGFKSDHMVTMWMNFTSTRYNDKSHTAQFAEQLAARINALPGVEGVAIANDLPLQGDDTTTGVGKADGHAPFDRGHRPLVGVHSINSGYFRAMGIPLLRGREFTGTDTANATHVAIINQKLADQLWPGQDPVGRHLTIMDDEKPSEVVGIAGNVLHNGLDSKMSLETYVPIPQNPWSYLGVAIRTRGDATALYAATRSIVAELDPELPIHDVLPMEQVIAETVSTRRVTLWLMGAFAALALILAFVGIYGVMSYAVTERVHEIGIRMAMGAQRPDVVRMVVGRGMFLAGVGLACGGVGSFFAARALRSMLFQVRPSDPWTYLTISVLLAAVALAACYFPARRASSVDPLVALRYE